MRNPALSNGLGHDTWGRAPILIGASLLVLAALVWQAIATSGNPNPAMAAASSSAAILDIGILVFREGLECILVLAAILAGTKGDRAVSRNPIAIGVGAGVIATLFTWVAAVHVLDDLGQNVSALALQAATGLLAVIVLLVVMNWFFHKVYWTGWISLHTKRKQALLEKPDGNKNSAVAFFWGMALLGFTSFYREGFEVVLFLQGYRLRLGNEPVLWGVGIGIFLTSVVAALTFVAHRHLPYRKMLVLTGILLGVVLIVMVGEQAQEMQLAHWIPTTNIVSLGRIVPNWMGTWFSIFPTVQTLLAQALAALLVLGSYFTANHANSKRQRDL